MQVSWWETTFTFHLSSKSLSLPLCYPIKLFQHCTFDLSFFPNSNILFFFPRIKTLRKAFLKYWEISRSYRKALEKLLVSWTMLGISTIFQKNLVCLVCNCGRLKGRSLCACASKSKAASNETCQTKEKEIAIFLKPKWSTILNLFFVSPNYTCHFLSIYGSSCIAPNDAKSEIKHLLPVISSSTICFTSWICKKKNVRKLSGNSFKGFLGK